MKKIFLTNLLFATLILSGCGFIRARDNVTVAEVEKNLYNLAKEGTALALNEIYDDNLDRKLLEAAQLSKKIDEFALPLLSNPGVAVDETLEDKLLDLVPEEFRGIMAAAYETFNTHYEFPTTTEFLSEPYLSYLRAFLSGVRDGANKVLTDNNAHIDTMHSIHREETGNGQH